VCVMCHILRQKAYNLPSSFFSLPQFTEWIPKFFDKLYLINSASIIIIAKLSRQNLFNADRREFMRLYPKGR
ncbi:MAG: hypothetical protein V7K57_26130, partial [Nostoc sp.]|uniref:hypothetical protein n=1 Tax=Nostoc sp. TaxID=1180 RepID=UPI002FFA7E4A